MVHLGKARPRDEIEWPALVPAEDVTGWLSLNFDTKFMKVNAFGAYSDDEASAR